MRQDVQRRGRGGDLQITLCNSALQKPAKTCKNLHGKDTLQTQSKAPWAGRTSMLRMLPLKVLYLQIQIMLRMDASSPNS